MLFKFIPDRLVDLLLAENFSLTLLIKVFLDLVSEPNCGSTLANHVFHLKCVVDFSLPAIDDDFLLLQEIDGDLLCLRIVVCKYIVPIFDLMSLCLLLLHFLDYC